MVDTIAKLGVAVFFLILFGLAFISPLAYVTSVYDGDTIWVLWRGKRTKIRLRLIDAPELDQDGGNASKRQLERLILHKWVKLENIKIDNHGRVLASVRIGHQDASEWMIKKGQAFAYMATKKARQLEDMARRAKLGIHGRKTIRPSDYRSSKKSGSNKS